MYHEDMKKTVTGAISGYASDQAAKRHPEINEQMEALEKSIAGLENVAERLIDRLQPMRCMSGALASGWNGTAPEPVLCALASNLRERRQRIERYTSQLHQALEELEI